MSYRRADGATGRRTVLGTFEVGEREDVDQLGAGSGTEGVQAFT